MSIHELKKTRSNESLLRVNTFGATVLDWFPYKGKSVFWQSHSPYEEGQPIRGGVPLCLPWFAIKSNYPKHGIVRTKEWSLDSISDAAEGNKKMMTFSYLHTGDSDWQHDFTAKLIISISEQEFTLEMRLIYINNSDESVKITGAFHNYFSVSHTSNVRISNLNDTAYFDKVKNKNCAGEDTEPGFTSYIDRVYRSSEKVIIQDSKRRIEISKSNMDSWVVWNPGNRVSDFSDIDSGEENNFICVEPVQYNPIEITSKESYEAIQNINVGENI